ncbi:hypothetical protein ANO11243_020670 [Dothideomycetidae sp. 11243]|nr:hypothetical protein ANO11243_020670 [fungal sp. No.11243]
MLVKASHCHRRREHSASANPKIHIATASVGRQVGLERRDRLLGEQWHQDSKGPCRKPTPVPKLTSSQGAYDLLLWDARSAVRKSWLRGLKVRRLARRRLSPGDSHLIYD